jgi:hypothetical protein
MNRTILLLVWTILSPRYIEIWLYRQPSVWPDPSWEAPESQKPRSCPTPLMEVGDESGPEAPVSKGKMLTNKDKPESAM